MSSPVPAPHPYPYAMSKAELKRLCVVFGTSMEPDLAHTDDGSGEPIEGPRLLWAMAARESSFGQNLGPRFEPAYFVGGFYYKKQTPGGAEIRKGVEKWGRDFACSFGPLQIMACNAKGFTPPELGNNPEIAMAAAVARLRVEVLVRQKAKSLGEICDAWNTGNFRDDFVPEAYINFVRTVYEQTETL